jgi:hypothetical protein
VGGFNLKRRSIDTNEKRVNSVFSSREKFLFFFVFNQTSGNIISENKDEHVRKRERDDEH